MTRPVGIEVSYEFVINPHSRCPRGERFSRVHAENDRKRIFALSRRGQFHKNAGRIDQADARTDPRESDWSALVNFYLEPIGSKPHDTGGFHPWNLLELCFPLREGHEVNVAPDVAAHHFHDLRPSHILDASNLDVIARFDAEAPRALAVAV